MKNINKTIKLPNIVQLSFENVVSILLTIYLKK